MGIVATARISCKATGLMRGCHEVKCHVEDSRMATGPSTWLDPSYAVPVPGTSALRDPSSGRNSGCSWAFSSAPSRRLADRTRAARSSGVSKPAGSTCRSRRAKIAVRAAVAWSVRAIGRDHRAFAAILARKRRCSGVTLRFQRASSQTVPAAESAGAGSPVRADRGRPRCRTARRP